ncbi:MAG: toxic anion resistance protein, partial [Bifidobacteriaceae bacterium]|nr:toxic anion resistance protein [Bifidobacteriaceae bacterium]
MTSPSIETAEAEVIAAIPGVDIDSLLTAADSAAPAAPLEKALSTVSTQDKAVAKPADARFQFRSLLTPEQTAALKKGAPALADKMVADLNTIITFGGPVLQKLNAASVQLLEEQRDIKLPDAEVLVNDLLREMDGFEKRFRNRGLEEKAAGLKKWFRSTKYSLKTMVRESKPLAEKLDLAEVKLQEMETRLGDNISRGQLMHKQTLEHLDEVVAVLAALEEITDVIRAEFTAADKLLQSSEAAGDTATVEWKGQKVTVNELREIHSNLATALSEVEKTWHDWRQQFFMGYAHAPSTRNLVITQFAMRRRLQTFRTMGIPSGRRSLALWQQAALAREGAEMGQAVQEGVNRLVQQSFKETADAVKLVAEGSQAPVITEDTVWVVIDSVKSQCEAIVAADAAGRQLRARNLKALEQGEVTIKDEFEESRRRIAQQ